MNPNRLFLGQVSLAGRSRPGLSGAAQAVTDADFQRVLAAPLAVVDFWSPTCPYCVEYKPVFEAVAASSPASVLMVTANVNDAMKSAAGFGLSGIPATIFLKNGKEVSRFEGKVDQAELAAAIQKLQAGGFPDASSGGSLPGSGQAPASPSSVPIWGIAAAALVLAGTAWYSLR